MYVVGCLAPSTCLLHTTNPSHAHAGYEVSPELPPLKSYALKARVHAADGALALELDMAKELQVRCRFYMVSSVCVVCVCTTQINACTCLP